VAKQTPKKRKPLSKKAKKPARTPKKVARASYVPLRDKYGRFKAKKQVTPRPKRKASKKALRPKVAPKSLPKKTGSSPVRGSTKPNKLIRPNKPKGKQTPKAVTARPPEYEVSSSAEKMVTIHTELRKRAIEESRLLIPDGRVRKVEDVYGRKALKKEVLVSKFVTESNLEDILYRVRTGLTQVERLEGKKPNVRYTVCLNLSEYGITLYGSNKGVIARVDGLRSEALHWTKWSTPSGSVQDVLTKLEGGLEGFLDKKLATTACVESVTVTALYGEQGRETGNG